jgi:hypothetical protein
MVIDNYTAKFHLLDSFGREGADEALHHPCRNRYQALSSPLCPPFAFFPFHFIDYNV